MTDQAGCGSLGYFRERLLLGHEPPPHSARLARMEETALDPLGGRLVSGRP